MNLFILRDFLSLPAIINLPLAPPLPANGQIGDSVPLDATLNYIVAQVNANAQPLSTTPVSLEWQPLGQNGTFISPTSFSVPGNFTGVLPTTILAIGRKLQTQNTAGLVYSTIVSSTFGAGNTTVTLKNIVGVLDGGLSTVNYGFSNPVTLSLPQTTYVYGDFSTNIPASTTTILGNGATYTFDALNETGGGATGRVTLTYGGTYLVSARGFLSQNSANVTLGMNFSARLFKNAVAAGGLGSVILFWPYASGVGTNDIPFSYEDIVSAVAGDILDVRMTTPAYTVATMAYFVAISITRIA